ncbi:hypothetical protein [Pseudoxanthomonas daejeonensis]|uniref:Secreted protein n=1 Tax=Pseudoxanthomonas daejeonensis TaxID=266062 RepID=A0ABQ6Z6K2_9GAMM|nr:hypothetical protein [Pseudoxanthomonas daejeonensis]KAF1694021.1 hypothetical protein CSC65_10185 [Pseudoxanthomonas daejeonensis]
MDTKRFLAAAFLAGIAFAATANEAPALTTCIDLGPDRDITRHGSTSSFSLRDGESYYHVELRGACHSLASARSVSIRSQGVDNRVCPKGTRVQTRYDICQVKRIEAIGVSPAAHPH